MPPGTNGAVSLLGTAAAAAGGLAIGACHWLASTLASVLPLVPEPACGPLALGWRAMPLALAAALAGSLLDSVLGATLQWSGVDEGSGRVVSGAPPPGAAGRVRHIAGRDWLSNTQVNALSSAATAGAGAAVAAWLLVN